MVLRSLFFVIAAAILLTAPAYAQRPIAAGTLRCGQSEPVIQLPFPRPPLTPGEIELKCLFKPANETLPQQVYLVRPQFARPTTLSAHSVLEWDVISGIPVTIAFLAGGYSSGLEDVPIASNLSGNLLVGGNANLIVLRPRQEPGNLAGGVRVMEAEFVGCQAAADVC